MFDTMIIAKKIKMSRIGKNMTQMQLADAMGVSYQAVSNWERGNSMPDISKLEDLCNALDISVSELLGMENKTTETVEKALREEELTVEEMVEIAPMLPPAKVKEDAKKSNQGKKKWDIGALSGIAPFLDEEFWDEIIDDIEVESLVELSAVAYCLSEEQLDKLARRAPKSDVVGIISIAPFIGEETMEYLIKDRYDMKVDSLTVLCDLAPFVDEDVLDELARKAPKSDIDGIVALAPFLSEETLDQLVRECDSQVDGALIGSLAPFLSEDTLDYLVDALLEEGNVKGLSGLYPFLSSETLRKIAKRLMEQGDLDELKNAAMFM